MPRHRIGNRDGLPPPGRPARPPHVLSRSLRIRWLVGIALVLVVPGLLMEHVPAIRAIVGLPPKAVPGGEPLAPGELANERVDTRAAAHGDPRGTSHDAVVRSETAPAGDILHSASAGEPAAGGPTDRRRMVQRDRWSRLRPEIEPADLTRLRQVLRAAGRGRPVTADEQPAWTAFLEQLDLNWKERGREAAAALAELAAAERSAWSTTLEEQDAEWTGTVLPALRAAGAGAPLDQPQLAALTEVTRRLDELAWEKVRDNTVMRGVEGEAWFRCLDDLRASDPRLLDSAAVERVGFVQLFKQPNEYRGKLVTVRGDVRLGYRVAAPVNPHGVAEYFVYWLKPTGGPNRPLVVYALETPPGFPPLREKSADQSRHELNESVEFTGYFFKNWAYQAHDQTRLAPLLLARAPRWQPAAATSASLPSGGQMILTAMCAAAAAVALTCYVYYRTPGRHEP